MQHYLVAFVPDDGGFSLFSPDFPEFSSCGDTLEDALFMAGDCLRVCVEEYAREGRALPEPCDAHSAQERVLRHLADLAFVPEGGIAWHTIPVATAS